MKKSSVTLGVSLSVSLIVVSLLLPVNHSLCQISSDKDILTADGSSLPPIPPPPPPPGKNLMLDGSSLPPIPPPPAPAKLGTGRLPVDGLLEQLSVKS